MWNGNAWTWVAGSNSTKMYGVFDSPNGGNIPGGRMFASGKMDSKGNFYLFGGYGYGQNSTGYLSDLWKYNSSAGWTWMAGGRDRNFAGNYGTQGIPSTDNSPCSRNGAFAWMDSKDNFWIFGGQLGISDLPIIVQITAHIVYLTTYGNLMEMLGLGCMVLQKYMI